MANKRPWMPFYVSDWLSSRRVLLMTPEQRGGYIQLLCHSWLSDDGGLDNDQDELAALSGLGNRWKQNAKAILRCFDETDGRLYNARIISELEKLNARSKAAAESAKARWESCERNANAMRTQCEVDTTSHSKRNATHTHTHTQTQIQTKDQPLLSERPTATPPAGHILGYFPVKGGEWPCYSSFVDEMESCYESPADSGWVFPELKKAKAWLIANPTKQKTARGMTRFINHWLSKASQDGNGRAAGRLAKARTDDKRQQTAHAHRNGNSGEPGPLDGTVEDFLNEIRHD